MLSQFHFLEHSYIQFELYQQRQARYSIVEAESQQILY